MLFYSSHVAIVAASKSVSLEQYDSAAVAGSFFRIRFHRSEHVKSDILSLHA